MAKILVHFAPHNGIQQRRNLVECARIFRPHVFLTESGASNLNDLRDWQRIVNKNEAANYRKEGQKIIRTLESRGYLDGLELIIYNLVLLECRDPKIFGLAEIYSGETGIALARLVGRLETIKETVEKKYEEGNLPDSLKMRRRYREIACSRDELRDKATAENLMINVELANNGVMPEIDGLRILMSFGSGHLPLPFLLQQAGHEVFVSFSTFPIVLAYPLAEIVTIRFGIDHDDDFLLRSLLCDELLEDMRMDCIRNNIPIDMVLNAANAVAESIGSEKIRAMAMAKGTFEQKKLAGDVVTPATIAETRRVIAKSRFPDVDFTGPPRILPLEEMLGENILVGHYSEEIKKGLRLQFQ